MQVVLISVIVTARDTAPYVCACIESIQASSHSELEIVVIDDGSSDGTGAILTELAAHDDRIKLKRTDGVGRREALVLAHDMAQGDAQCWVDSDDVIDPRAIELAAARLSADEQLVYTHREMIDETGRRLGPDRRNKIRYRPDQLLVDNMIFHLRMFTTELFERAGGVGDLSSAIDWDMNLRMTEHTTPAAVPRVLYQYRVRKGRMTGRPDQHLNARLAVERAISRRHLPYELVTRTQTRWQIRRRPGG